MLDFFICYLATIAWAVNAQITSATSLSFPASYCYLSYPPCSTLSPLWDACRNEYGTDIKYLYCLCTTSYHDFESSCDACQANSRSSTDTSYLAHESSYHSSECASLTSQYGGSGQSSPRPASGSAQTTATSTTAQSDPTGGLLSGLVAGDGPSPTQGAGSAAPTNAGSHNMHPSIQDSLIIILSTMAIVL